MEDDAKVEEAAFQVIREGREGAIYINGSGSGSVRNYILYSYRMTYVVLVPLHLVTNESRGVKLSSMEDSILLPQ